MGNPRLIDNVRRNLEEVLKSIIESEEFEDLSIATGYWDLPGMTNLVEGLKNFKKIRLLIGQEPLPSRIQKSLTFDINKPEQMFPDENFAFDLELLGKEKSSEVEKLRAVAKDLASLMNSGILEVRVFRHPRLHAKAYIFGNTESSSAIGIIGSSNFTKAGLTNNAELNYLEEDPRQVLYHPKTKEQEHGHLSWFNELWNDPEAIPWTGDFARIVENSPVGDLTYGPYDVYIRTLMEVFPDELAPKETVSNEVADVLYAFQNRNAGILLQKLKKMGVAMLSDSVGLGKTITAGAVIKHYRELGARRIIVIAPASLEQQWRDDLGVRFGLDESDYAIISMQNLGEQKRLIEDMEKPWVREVDLFVIDEAHNLRNPGSARYESILELLDTSPKAPVLLLTATPINNSLMDFANQIQLGLRGEMTSVPVQYRNTNGDIETLDFLEALKRIQAESKKAEKNGESFAWEKYSSTLRSGLRHFLVRSTRQGVEAEGSLVKGGQQQHFPKTTVKQLSYKYPSFLIELVQNQCSDSIDSVFEGIDPLLLNLSVVSDITQHSMHPIDLYGPVFRGEKALDALDLLAEDGERDLFMSKRSDTLIPSIFQVVNMLGYVPYRPDMYRHRYYGKSRGQLRELALKGDERAKISTQRAIHNILHVTWLKRLESSASALLCSVDYYAKRLELFEKYLKAGYIVPLTNIDDLESEYGDDLEKAFSDYEKSYKKIQSVLDRGEDASTIRLEGIERIVASEQDYKLDILQKDIQRDKAIVKLLQTMLKNVREPKDNGKLSSFADKLKKITATENYGKKVLIFSFFADTIDYLQESLPALMSDIPHFNNRSAFISGSGGNAEEAARRFAPSSKKYTLKDGEQEIDYLFATDVLSEGQNLQDAAILVNYDLHWNPVRMIQRNGRINRLGSEFPEVLIVNMKPHEDLELYLNLVRKLESKIDTIKNSIGTDQSVLGEKENPIEFADDYYSDDVVKASAVANENFGTTSALDVYDSSDEYIFELRSFLEEHKNDSVMKRVQSIPMGKWNYLPNRANNNEYEVDEEHCLNKFGPTNCLCLERVEGHNVSSGETFNTTLFVTVKAEKRYEASPIEEVAALSLIRTSPDDNKPTKDIISESIDRTKVARRASSMAKVQAESTDLRDLKPSEQKALAIIQNYYDKDLDILGTIRKGIHKAQDNREFMRLVKLINAEDKENGVVSASVQKRFAALMNKLIPQLSEERKAERIEEVLFYVKHDANECR